MKKIPLTLALILGFSLAINAAKRPEWVDSIPNKPHMYQGIGIADATGSKAEDRLRADQNARTEIIQEISSTISSEISSFYSESSSNGSLGGSQSMDVFTSLSSAYAEETIEGLKIVDRYYDKKNKVYYTYATLLRSSFQEQMANKAQEARKLAQERFQYASAALAEGNVSGALEQLSQALTHVMVAQSVVKKQLQGDLNSDGKSGFLDAGLSQEISNITSKISFVKLAGDGQKGERNQALAQPFEGQVTYSAGEQEIPLSNLSLSFAVSGAEADYEPVITTNAQGKFSVRVHKLHSASIPNPTGHINLHLPHMSILAAHSGQSGTDFMPVAVDFEFQMDVAASVRIFVRVLEEINGEPVSRSKSDGMLVKALVGKQYKVIDARQIASTVAIEQLDQFVGYDAFESLTEALKGHADYAVVGLVYSETSSTGTLNYARAGANLNAIDLTSGRIIATGQLENIKAAGNTEKKANTSAIRKCSNTAIADLLAQLDQALQ